MIALLSVIRELPAYPVGHQTMHDAIVENWLWSLIVMIAARGEGAVERGLRDVHHVMSLNPVVKSMVLPNKNWMKCLKTVWDSQPFWLHLRQKIHHVLSANAKVNKINWKQDVGFNWLETHIEK